MLVMYTKFSSTHTAGRHYNKIFCLENPNRFSSLSQVFVTFLHDITLLFYWITKYFLTHLDLNIYFPSTVNCATTQSWANNIAQDCVSSESEQQKNTLNNCSWKKPKILFVLFVWFFFLFFGLISEFSVQYCV